MSLLSRVAFVFLAQAVLSVPVLAEEEPGFERYSHPSARLTA